MKCKICKAKWRTYYPFGKNSNSLIIFEKKHNKHCKYNKENKWKNQQDMIL